jgi:putative membrane protein
MAILEQSISGLPAFVLYFVVSLGLLALFLTVYLRVTPYHEIALIRQGNAAAALSLAGTTLGFVIPLARAIAQSVSLPDMLLWGGIAFVVQMLVYLIAARLLPDIGKHIADGKLAHATTLGALSLATGILNAACMTY